MKKVRRSALISGGFISANKIKGPLGKEGKHVRTGNPSRSHFTKKVPYTSKAFLILKKSTIPLVFIIYVPVMSGSRQNVHNLRAPTPVSVKC